MISLKMPPGTGEVSNRRSQSLMSREEGGGRRRRGLVGVGVGALTWVKLRRTRTGGHWERKTDR